MYVVIMGCGRLGAQLANLLFVEGHEVAVIDRDEDAFRRLRNDFKGKKVIGVGFDREVLEKAGIKKADAFVAVSRGDNHNIVSAIIAKNIFRVPRVVARIYDQERAKLYWKLGVPTVAPGVWASNKIRDYLFHYELKERVNFGNAEVELFEIECPPHLVGRAVADLNVPQEILVGVIVREGKAFIPTPGSRFEEGDSLQILVSSQAIPKFEEAIKG
jgi:trk system potassium uptake protein TrkA